MPKQMMGTVDKALSLMRFFSPQIPELGLSELARKSGFDKATTLRCLNALERNGFVEQDVLSRKYRVGLSPFHLAQIREQSFPVESIIAEHLDALAARVGETAHGTLMAGRDPVTVAISSPNRALFVHVSPSTALPWHATASGIAIAAHLPDEAQKELLDRLEFAPFTPKTPSNKEDMRTEWNVCRESGIACVQSTFEDDVVGTAAPIFGQTGHAVGSVAIASVALRMTPDLQTQIASELRRVSQIITNTIGGVLPVNL
jgi:IclR family acetate operon transcriptional repressor